MDLQWILDKLIDVGKITAGQNERLNRVETDVAGLKGLYDRVKKLEVGEDFEIDERHVRPQHRQALFQAISIGVAIASVAVNVFIYFASRLNDVHPIR